MGEHQTQFSWTFHFKSFVSDNIAINRRNILDHFPTDDAVCVLLFIHRQQIHARQKNRHQLFHILCSFPSLCFARWAECFVSRCYANQQLLMTQSTVAREIEKETIKVIKQFALWPIDDNLNLEMAVFLAIKCLPLFNQHRLKLNGNAFMINLWCFTHVETFFFFPIVGVFFSMEIKIGFALHIVAIKCWYVLVFRLGKLKKEIIIQ